MLYVIAYVILTCSTILLQAENPVSRLWFDQTGSCKGCDLSHGKKFKKSIKKLKLLGKKIDLSDAYLEGADLSDADLYGANLENAHLDNAHLEHADLRHSVLKNVSLSNAHLKGAHLDSADLEWADLEGADLEGAILKSAYLRFARLYKAHIKNADFKYAVLDYANFAETDIESALNLLDNGSFYTVHRYPQQARRILFKTLYIVQPLNDEVLALLQLIAAIKRECEIT